MPGGLHPPLELFLAWPRPNYVDPITKPKYVLFFSCLLGPISLVLLLARLWVRLRIQKNAGWDDWLMLASWVRDRGCEVAALELTDGQFPVMGLTVIFPLGECFQCHVLPSEQATHGLMSHKHATKKLTHHSD
jgi:hypothetical protein